MSDLTRDLAGTSHIVNNQLDSKLYLRWTDRCALNTGNINIEQPSTSNIN